MIGSKLTIMTLAMLASIGVLSANATGNKEEKVCPELCSIAPFIPQDDCSRNFQVEIGLLYQQIDLNNMFPGFSYENTLDVDIDGVDYADTDGKALFSSFNYAVGLTASLGYFMKHDDWYVGAKFDWIRQDLSINYNYTDNADTYVLFAIPYFVTNNLSLVFDSIIRLDDYDAFDRLDYTGDVNFYMLDIILSRGSYHSKYFSYEPFIGVKALWFDSSLKVSLYQKGGDDYGYSITSSNNWGVGPEFGVNGEFHLSKYFAIFTDSEIGVTCGESNQKITLYYTNYSEGSLESLNNDTIKGNVESMIYVPVRSVLGLKASTYYRDDMHYLALKVGYDVRAVMSFPVLDRGIYLSGLYTDLIWSF